MNSTEIGLVAERLAELCVGGQVRKAYDRGPDSVVLQVHGRKGNVFVLLSAHRQLHRVHTLVEKEEWQASSPLVKALRQRVVGARVAKVEAVPGDRRLHLTFAAGEKVHVLEAELFGIGSNLILVDAQGRIAEALRHARGQKRTVLPGKPYVPPPAVEPRSPESRFGSCPADVDRAAREHYEPLQAEADLADARKRLRSRLSPLLKKAEAKARSLTQAAERVAEREAEKRKGELLKASLHLVQPGAASVRVPDYFDPDTPQVEIKLDPKLSPTANVERCFKRYRKIKTAAKLAAEQLPSAQQDAARLRDAVERLDRAASLQELDALSRGVIGRPLEREAHGKRRQSRAGPRSFASADGFAILVGRTDAENDTVTFRMANGNDHWFHVQGMPGSHVIVKTQKGKSVPLETLLDAAALAKLYSKAKEAAAAEVDYTQRKYVRKRKAAGPGDVDYSQYKTLNVRKDDARLARLFGQ